MGHMLFPNAKRMDLKVSTWDVESMWGQWGEISETLKRRCVDICCLQEVR